MVCALFEIEGVTVTGVVPTFVFEVPLLRMTVRPLGLDVTVKDVADVDKSAGPPGDVQLDVVVVPLPPVLLLPLLPPGVEELPPPPPHAVNARVNTRATAASGSRESLFTVQFLS